MSRAERRDARRFARELLGADPQAPRSLPAVQFGYETLPELLGGLSSIDDEQMAALSGALNDWESELDTTEIVGLRLEVASAIGATTAVQVGSAWEQLGMDDGAAKGTASQTMLYFQAIAEATGVDAEEGARLVRAGDHIDFAIRCRDSLIETAEREVPPQRPDRA